MIEEREASGCVAGRGAARGHPRERLAGGLSGLASVVALAVVVAAALPPPAAAAAHHPFASHEVAYAAGAILPSHVSQAALDQAVRDFYDAWKAEYLEQACGAGRYVVRTRIDAANLTVSEGHGYGMMIAALMAGHDPEARAVFDGMYAYFREHPTATHAHLMSWYQRRSCADANGNDSATDGDLDIAFALLLADKQWGSCGAIDYAGEAAAILADVRDGEIDASGGYTLLGDWVTPSSGAFYDSSRSSDWMVDHFRSFAAATGDPFWTGLADAAYAMVDSLQTQHAPATGLLPGFVTDPLGSPAPAPPGFLEGPDDGSYDFNACRDPWRLATDFLVSGDARAAAAVQRINAWIQAETGGDPAAIRAGYQLSGAPSPGSDFLSMAFVAPLGVAAMVDASNQAWLNAIWDEVAARPLAAEGYYENTLKLLAMIVMSGNWWAPESVTTSCTPEGTLLCTNPGSLLGADIRLRRPGEGPGASTMLLRGTLFFPQGIPVAALDGGAQILVEDLGAGGNAVFDLTTATAPIPGAAAASCDPRDGWKASGPRTLYRNRSGALDAPACSEGSANGLKLLRYRSRSGFDVDVAATARRSTVPAVTGPLRATVVLGPDAAAGAAGECAVSASLACETSPSGRSVRCR